MRADGAHPREPPRPVTHGRDAVFAQIGAALAHAAAGGLVVACSKMNRGSGETALCQEIGAGAVKGGFHVVQLINPEGWDFYLVTSGDHTLAVDTPSPRASSNR